MSEAEAYANTILGESFPFVNVRKWIIEAHEAGRASAAEEIHQVRELSADRFAEIERLKQALDAWYAWDCHALLSVAPDSNKLRNRARELTAAAIREGRK